MTPDEIMIILVCLTVVMAGGSYLIIKVISYLTKPRVICKYCGYYNREKKGLQAFPSCNFKKRIGTNYVTGEPRYRTNDCEYTNANGRCSDFKLREDLITNEN